MIEINGAIGKQLLVVLSRGKMMVWDRATKLNDVDFGHMICPE
jgi:hypothetical protein